MIVSIWTDFAPGNSSLIKFGSWDTHGVAKDSDLTVIRSTTQYSWNFKIKTATFSGESLIPQGESRVVNFDPQLPYIYIPEKDFEIFR
jgi:hypothetical protein